MGFGPCENLELGAHPEDRELPKAAQTCVPEKHTPKNKTAHETGVQAWWMQGVVRENTANGIAPKGPGGSKRVVSVSSTS